MSDEKKMGQVIQVDDEMGVECFRRRKSVEAGRTIVFRAPFPAL
jgi:hypothetical protein